MAELRQKIPVDRDIPVQEEQYAKGVTREQIIAAAKQMKDDEFVKQFVRRTGNHVPFGSMDDTPVWYDYAVIVATSYRDETDAEYLARMNEQERYKRETEDKERREFLRLKAKFEPDEKV